MSVRRQDRNLQRVRDGRHVYLSTACYHDRHGECLRTCRVCAEPCVCTCHLRVTR